MVRLADGRGGDCGCDGTSRSGISGGQGQGAGRTGESAEGVGGRAAKELMTFVYRPRIPSAFRLFDRALEFKFSYYILSLEDTCRALPMPSLQRFAAAA